jgi:hypothetical protein
MPAHTKECEGNLLVGTQIWSLRVPGPLDGASDAPTAGHLLCRFVPRSGCSRLLWPDSMGFAFKFWALVDPTTIVGPILDTFAVSCDV